MKWFKVDSNTPDDPKIKAVLTELGNAGLGMLLRLWCYIAAHGTRAPGLSCDSKGRKIDRSALVAATGGNETEFDALMCVLSRERHISQKKWKSKGIVFLPAMSKRADVYSQRRVRTNFAQSADKVPPEEKRREEIRRSKYKNIDTAALPAPRLKPARKNRKDPYPVVLKLTYGVLGRIPIKQPVELASLKEDVKQQCAKFGIAYEGDVVGRAVESALAARAKVAGASR